MRIWTLLKKDARVVLRSRLLLVVLVLYPLVIVGIIGYAFSDPKQKIPLAVVNEDVDEGGNPNQAMIEDPFGEQAGPGVSISSGAIVEQLEELANVKRQDDRSGALQLLLEGEVQAVVVLPNGFVGQVARFGNGSARLEVVVDMSDPVRATIMENNIRGVVQRFQESVIQAKVDIVVGALEESLDVNLPPTHFAYPGFGPAIEYLEEIRDTQQGNLTDEQRQRIQDVIDFLGNIELGVASSVDIVRSVAQPVLVDIRQEQSGHLFIRDLVVPAALGLSIFWTGSLATASLIVYERESPAYARLGVTPTARSTILLSKVVLTAAIILAQSALILLASVVAFGTRIDDPILTVALVMLSTWASIGLGILLSGISRDVNGSVLLSVLATFPMLFLSGLFYPVDFMPSGAQFLAGLFPLTYTVSGLRGAMLRGFSPVDALPEIYALFFFGLLLGLAGIALGRRYERRR